MKVKGRNASVEKTKRKIREAFFEMHRERIPGDEMTVKDLVRRADISRSTFYTHYGDLYDVGDELARIAMDEIMGDWTPKDKQDVQKFFVHMLGVMGKYEEMLRMLLCSDYPMAFFDQLRGQLKQRIRAVEVTDANWEVRMSVLVDGTIQQLVAYFKGEYPGSREQCFSGLTESCGRLL